MIWPLVFVSLQQKDMEFCKNEMLFSYIICLVDRMQREFVL